jgi:hypothetical protein
VRISISDPWETRGVAASSSISDHRLDLFQLLAEFALTGNSRRND